MVLEISFSLQALGMIPCFRKTDKLVLIHRPMSALSAGANAYECAVKRDGLRFVQMGGCY